MEKKTMQSLCICRKTTTIGLNGVSYLDREENWKKKRKIKEALYINSINPEKLIYLEKGFEINQCWNEFNPHI